jgi:hypothetical protein
MDSDPAQGIEDLPTPHNNSAAMPRSSRVSIYPNTVAVLKLETVSLRALMYSWENKFFAKTF